MDRDKLDELLFFMANSGTDNEMKEIKDGKSLGAKATKQTQSKIKTKPESSEQNTINELNKQLSQLESEKKVEDESDEGVEKTTNNDSESTLKEQELETDELGNGPPVPDLNSISSVKTPREISSKDDVSTENKPVVLLLDPSVRLTDSEDLKEETEEKNVPDDIASKNETSESKFIKEEESSPEENGNLGGIKEIQQLGIPSLKDVPLEKGEDKSYSPKLYNSFDNTKNEENEQKDGGDTEEGVEKQSITTVPIVMQVPSSLVSTQTPEDTSEVPSTIDETDQEYSKDVMQKGSKKADDTARRLKLLKEREEKWLAIRKKILETREKFKALTKDDNWKSTLQQREEEIRALLNQEKEQRKKVLALSRPGSETPLSRTRRLTYYPEDDDSKEDLYEYEPEDIYQKKMDPYNIPLSINEGKLPVNQDLFSHVLKQDRNHIIFPLDPKTPQAVVYNNKIIPAKLYGLVNLFDCENSRAGSGKPVIEPQGDSFLQKYYTKSYDPPIKYNSLVTPTPSLKSLESISPKDLYLRRLEDSSNYLPVVVLPPESTGLRRKRSLPDVTYNKHLDKNHLDSSNNKHILKKRSILPKDTRIKKSVTDIPKETVTEIISNEIKPENYNAVKKYFPDTSLTNEESFLNDRYGTIEIGPLNSDEPIKLTEPRTFNILPSLLAPGQNLLPLPNLRPAPLPPFYRTLPPGPLRPPSQQILPEPLPPYRTFPSEPLQRPLEGIPELHRTYPPEPLPEFQEGMLPEPIPNIHRNFPPEPFPPVQDFSVITEPFMPVPESPKEEKHVPETSKAYFMTMLQDKFRSLMGMLDTLAVWCGVNASK